ncbi:bestrophin family protein [Robiginitalea biformata]|uniref:Uncharacterized protein n=1 Tax=Robiginitalea biformata (strain ATCC BAA-864 / DSM 15991 / KCTC 12146 / HTCC2501) TaxID=313596 RepID=A4CGG9_ROBBH|nr:bestrophin family ion channel [Robiginitalea biformata]EAR16027.1 hypothetical protein RB2501_03995 [Robiginitalea biformata HTCC2501]
MDPALYFFFIIIAVIPVLPYHLLGWKWLHLPWLPIGLVGTALAFIIGFKNNASYGRLWEARKIWGGIVNTSRSFTAMINDFITNQFADTPKSPKDLQAIRVAMVLRHVAWMTSLRHALRVKKPWEVTAYNKIDQKYMERMEIREYTYSLEDELEGYLSDEEKRYVLSLKNKQSACLTLQSKHLAELRQNGLIEDFRHMEMQGMITELFTLQGQAERIKNFPYPRQFATLNLYFVWLFILLLPFALMSEFDQIGQSLLETGDQNPVFRFIALNFVWLSVPFSVVISWIFLSMERIGDVSENPFEGNPNDVPITTMSRGIEIDIRQMVGDDPEAIPGPIPEEWDSQM